MVITLWIIFILSGLGLTVFLLFKLSESASVVMNEAKSQIAHLRFWPVVRNWLWHFILEAKDLHPGSKIAQTVKQAKHQIGSWQAQHVFRVRIRSNKDEPEWLPEAVSEDKNIES